MELIKDTIVLRYYDFAKTESTHTELYVQNLYFEQK